MAAGAVSLRKSHDIVISSYCNIVKGQAICIGSMYLRRIFFGHELDFAQCQTYKSMH